MLRHPYPHYIPHMIGAYSPSPLHGRSSIDAIEKAIQGQSPNGHHLYIEKIKGR
ncbi:hypothetical protein [Peribacillus sp. CSMR9]|uniref:hypothetical protein n=1 Tax=Peribacillus sp. CSMR9 TaxID=2981350 RepID=UPI002954E6F7|nr:hypothetical protein [Peribacillus sp. CSMR9]MDV7764232.1 hypothetical protein [Peribacillus sp. CSMR9]